MDLNKNIKESFHWWKKKSSLLFLRKIIIKLCTCHQSIVFVLDMQEKFLLTEQQVFSFLFKDLFAMISGDMKYFIAIELSEVERESFFYSIEQEKNSYEII